MFFYYKLLFFFLCYSQGSIFFFFKVLCVGRLFPLWVSIQHSKGLMTRCLKGWRLRTSVLISLIVFSFSPPLPRTSQKEIPPLHPPTRRTKEPSVSSGSPNSSPWAIHTRVRAHMHISSSTRQTIAWSLWNCQKACTCPAVSRAPSFSLVKKYWLLGPAGAEIMLASAHLEVLYSPVFFLSFPPNLLQFLSLTLPSPSFASSPPSAFPPPAGE